MFFLTTRQLYFNCIVNYYILIFRQNKLMVIEKAHRQAMFLEGFPDTRRRLLPGARPQPMPVVHPGGVVPGEVL